MSYLVVIGNNNPVGSEKPCTNLGLLINFSNATYGNISTKKSPPAAHITKLISLFSNILFISSALTLAVALLPLSETLIFSDNTHLNPICSSFFFAFSYFFMCGSSYAPLEGAGTPTQSPCFKKFG